MFNVFVCDSAHVVFATVPLAVYLGPRAFFSDQTYEDMFSDTDWFALNSFDSTVYFQKYEGWNLKQ